MKKAYLKLMKVSTALVFFVAVVMALTIRVNANEVQSKTWNYKTEKAHLSSYDKYSCNQAAFKNTEWKILSESQLKEISQSSTKVNIKLDCSNPASGDVLFVMNTKNGVLAYRAFMNMTFNGKTNPYLNLEKIDYYAGTGGTVFYVRCDPVRKTEVTKTYLRRERNGQEIGYVYTVVNPKHDFKLTVNENSAMDKPEINYKYSYQKRKGSNNTYDLVLTITVSKTITGAPKQNYGLSTSYFEIIITEATLPKKMDTFAFVYHYDKTTVKRPEMNGCYLIEAYVNGCIVEYITYC